jgi:hypothetical protein
MVKLSILYVLSIAVANLLCWAAGPFKVEGAALWMRTLGRRG